MEPSFHLALTHEERRFLGQLVQWSIRRGLVGERVDGDAVPVPPPGTLHALLGAFVTLHRNGALRGCIGSIVGHEPLFRNVCRMAHAAAFEDSRFPPVTAAELDTLTVEISVMGPLTPCPDPARIEVGRHGLLVRRRDRTGLLLPQVAVEQGWNVQTFLEQTCRKAGLGKDSWREPGTELFWFEAVVFTPPA